jgi:hypothetical protein
MVDAREVRADGLDICSGEEPSLAGGGGFDSGAPPGAQHPAVA